MKSFLWFDHWTQNTYGLTGRLLERGLERYVEFTQIVALPATYLLSWHSLRRRRPAGAIDGASPSSSSA